jgi:flagellar capping protein FliD
MATGYTSEIKNGISFEHFVLRCAKAIGYLIDMRDDPIGKKIVDEIKIDESYEADYLSSKERYEKIKNLTTEEIEKEIKKAKKEHDKYAKTLAKNNDSLKKKYEEMLSKVRNWKPPTKEHVALKDFMISQIEESIEFDCSSYYHQSSEYVSPTPAQWLNEAIDKAKNNITYYKERLDEEIECIKKRNEWVKKLKESL